MAVTESSAESVMSAPADCLSSPHDNSPPLCVRPPYTPPLPACGRGERPIFIYPHVTQWGQPAVLLGRSTLCWESPFREEVIQEILNGLFMMDI